MAALPSRARLAIRVALAVLEHASLGRRFSRRAAPVRLQRLHRLERSRGLRRDLFHLLKALTTLTWASHAAVVEAVGAAGSCRVRANPSPSPPVAVSAEGPSDLDGHSVDVLVVGSGAGGAAAARVLAEAGLSVLVVEEGPLLDAASYPRDTVQALLALYRDGGFTACEGRPAIPLPLGRCVGGTTVVNSGTCLRPSGDVLLGWRERFGIPWSTDLGAELEAVERDLGVEPVDPATAGRNAELCRAGAEALGASNGPLPRNAPGVSCCGTCPTGCELDAKLAMHVSELPRAQAAGARLVAGARVERVVVERGRAVGVRCADADEIRARAVVVAAGAIGTPELLLRSGVANSSGELGRRLRIHPACWVGAEFEEEVRGWEGVMQSWYVDEWSDRGLFLEATFTPLAFGAHWLGAAGGELLDWVTRYGHLGVIGVHRSDRSEGRVTVDRRGRARLRYRLQEEDAASIRYGIARAAELHFAAGARRVYPQLAGVASVGPGEASRVEDGRFRPADLRLEAFHPMGTARMGADPRRSVVSPSGETHDARGLWIADASLFPSSLGVNPMITIMACARRVARELASRL